MVTAVIWLGFVSYLERPDLELSRDRDRILIHYGNNVFEFPYNIERNLIAGSIDDWIKSENALSKKLRDKVILTEDERKRYADRLHGGQQPETWEIDDLVLVGDELARKAITERPEPVWKFVTHYVSLSLWPPVLLLGFGVVFGWVLRGFLPDRRAA